jgi:hypothetical protein
MGIGLHMDPNKPPIGRQALSAIWTPSKPRYPWFGTIRGAQKTKLAFVGGDRFTLEQEAALIELGRDIPTAASMMVKRQALGDEIYRGPYDLPEVFEFECPTTGKVRADGKVQVVTPAGGLAYVYTDGWALRPYRTPSIYSMRPQR